MCYAFIYMYAFSRRFYPKRLTVHSGYTNFVSMFILLTSKIKIHNTEFLRGKNIL